MSKVAKKGRAKGVDGKVRFLAVLESELIKRLKVRAIRQGVTSSSVLEAAVADWLRRNRSRPPNPPAKIPSSAKKQFLAQLDPDLIRSLKIMAMDWNAKASSLVGEAVRQWLERNEGS